MSNTTIDTTDYHLGKVLIVDGSVYEEWISPDGEIKEVIINNSTRKMEHYFFMD